MGRLAVVGGHSILETPYGRDAPTVDVAVRGGSVGVRDAGSHVVVQRHGLTAYRPAHLVDHVANLGALVELGCDRVLALSSVGSLRADLEVGIFLAPDDFVALDQVVSSFDDARGHRVPGFDVKWRARMLDAWADAVGVPALVDGGTYWQSSGPRFETPAEIRFVSQFADVIGMTAASEAIVAGELGLAYAVVCVVDNLANGVGGHALSVDDFEAGKAANAAAVQAALAAVVPALS